MLVTRADGQMPTPPYIVHQGAELCEAHAMNLPATWGVHATQSGYMDRDGFTMWAHHFVANCGRSAATPTRAVILFLDSHALPALPRTPTTGAHAR